MLNSIETINEQILNYGLSFVISCIFMYIIIKLVDIGLEFLKIKIHRVKHDEELSARVVVDKKIQDLLNYTLQICHGDRLQVIEFTNTVMNVAYLPFRYMSCTYESFDYALRPIALNIDHVSTSLFSKFFETLEGNDYFIFDMPAPTSEWGPLYDLCSETRPYQLLCVKLLTTKNKPIGFLSLMVIESEISDEQIKIIQKLGLEVSALLAVSNKL